MGHSTYLPEKMGSAAVTPTGAFEAGSYQEFTVTYTAGYFGIDDTGLDKNRPPVCLRHGPPAVR